MREINLSSIFRKKIDEGIYSYDIVAVDTSTLVSSLVGYCLVNTKTDKSYVGLDKSINLSEEEMIELGKKNLEEAKQMEIIFS